MLISINLLILTCITICSAGEPYLDQFQVFPDSFVSTNFAEINFISKYKPTPKKRCFAECAKDAFCLSATFNNGSNIGVPYSCFLYSDQPDPNVDFISVPGQVVYIKQSMYSI
jgi:hypothetical protein